MIRTKQDTFRWMSNSLYYLRIIKLRLIMKLCLKYLLYTCIHVSPTFIVGDARICIDLFVLAWLKEKNKGSIEWCNIHNCIHQYNTNYTYACLALIYDIKQQNKSSIFGTPANYDNISFLWLKQLEPKAGDEVGI